MIKILSTPEIQFCFLNNMEKLLGSILGNVNTLISFRLSRKDAMTIAPEIDPEDKDKLIKDLINLTVGQSYLKIKGEPARLTTLPYPQSPQVSDQTIQAFKQECAFYHALSSYLSHPYLLCLLYHMVHFFLLCLQVVLAILSLPYLYWHPLSNF